MPFVCWPVTSGRSIIPQCRGISIKYSFKNISFRKHIKIGPISFPQTSLSVGCPSSPAPPVTSPLYSNFPSVLPVPRLTASWLTGVELAAWSRIHFSSCRLLRTCFFVSSQRGRRDLLSASHSAVCLSESWSLQDRVTMNSYFIFLSLQALSLQQTKKYSNFYLYFS